MSEKTPPRGSATRRPMQIRRVGTSPNGNSSSSTQIAHTLTACCRCRNRKTRCDPGLPRCAGCEKANSSCEYFDPSKGTTVPRNYVVHLQHKVRDLERQLEEMEKDELDPGPEDIVRHGARVHIQEHDESKFLGPSSGIAITRLVMQLAKQFTDSQSISDIVDKDQQENIKKRFEEEEEKPTSKVYPLISDVAAEGLPPRTLTNLLVDLFMAKLMAMYPIFHEPTFQQDVTDVYNGSTDCYQNFVLRMVIAISLQRMDTQYAGLADSYYLAALRYLEGAVKPMNIKTIQCFILIGAYSLLTPTRTAVYYVIGLAVRLAEALGLAEEKTLTQPTNGKHPNPLEIDIRRRIYWSVTNMEYALAHSLGRSSCFVTLQEHIDVKWYETVDDQYISQYGVKPGAPGSLKKWISIHFHKMRLHQLEIRRKLYQKKRPSPTDDQDPWFKQMEEKILLWREASPETDVGTGLDKAWFVGRYHTMVAMMFRPTPQIPRPTVRAAERCYESVISNIYMHRAQILARNVEMTWIFTQAIFMTINTILWTLSYSEIRTAHSREEVQGHLDVAIHCIKQAMERWPGVSSAIELYRNLIEACLKIYDKDGDILVAAGSPAESGPDGSSRTTSPALILFPADSKVAPRSSTPPGLNKPPAPFGYIRELPYQSRQDSFAQFSQISNSSLAHTSSPANPHFTTPTSFDSAVSNSTSNGNRQTDRSSTESHENISTYPLGDSSFNPAQYNNPLPSAFGELAWNPSFTLSQGMTPLTIPALSPFDQPSSEMNGFEVSPNHPVQYSDYLYPPSWDMDRSGIGLNQEQHHELMQSLESDGTGQLQHMINATNAVFYPQGRGY